MAQRRMFSPQIIDSDAFLDMPVSAQNLYFHLGMRADDDGFVGNPKKILKMTGGTEDDFKILLAKRFILAFESGVIVIKHWRINNLVRKDWYKPTQYVDEKEQLSIKENGSYTELVNENATIRSRRLGKVRLGKVSLIEGEHAPELISDPESLIQELVNKGIPKFLAEKEIKKFISYWTESNGRKERWQMEKVFDVNRRLATWFSRIKDFKQSKIANI